MAVDIASDSDFAHAVYQWLAAVPAGRVVSYGQLARLAGYPRHARFVGRLMSHLPPDSRLPWWRVVRGDGDITQGDRQKQKLIDEGVAVIGMKVRLGREGWAP